MQNSFFDASFFSANRQRLITNTKAELIVMVANARLQKSADVPLPFMQDTNFWYLTGSQEEEAVLVLDQTNGEEYLVLAPRDEHHDLWDGVQSRQYIVERSGIQQVYSHREGWQKLKIRLASAKAINSVTPPPVIIKHFDFHANPARRILAKKLKHFAPQASFEDVRLHMRDLRIIKQPQELAAIQKAIDITFIGLRAVKKALPELHFEYELEALLTYEYRRHGAAGHGFEPIVCAGANAATVHYIANSAPIQPNDPVLIDTGALVESYTADISRTILPSESLSDRYMAVYDAVKRVHEFAFTLLKPGVIHRTYEQQMCEFMGEELVKLGLIKKFDNKLIRRYFPHNTSHHLGLDVHDLSAYDEAWEENMVLTVEPGIYIPAEGIGVRIEEDVLITKDGYRLLNPLGI